MNTNEALENIKYKHNDILFVKDGTYLIGNCALISKYDTKIIFQSHLYKIRCNDWKILSPYLFLASISSDIVIRQIQSKRFTQDIIDTIGKRIYELILPIPKDQKKRLYIENLVKKSINERIEAKELSKKAISQIC
jgi:type I restriction enzyme M protein